MRFLFSFFTLVFFASFNIGNYQFDPKDKTKYYFTKTAYDFFTLTPEVKIELTKEERKLMLKTTGLSNEDIDYVLERCQKKYEPKSYRRSEKFIMYKIYSFNCEQLINSKGSSSKWITYALLYIKKSDNKHMPPTMFPADEEGFFCWWMIGKYPQRRYPVWYSSRLPTKQEPNLFLDLVTAATTKIPYW